MTDALPTKPTFFLVLKRFTVRFMRFVLLASAALVTAWLLYQSFPHKSHWFLAWVAFAPFVWGISKMRGFWSAFCYGWITSFVFHAGALYWIYYTCVHGGGMDKGLSMAAWLGLAALLSLQFAFWSGCCHFLTKLKGFFPLLAAGGWVALEWAHQTIAFYGLGFPWFMLGYTQWNRPEFLQIASYVGTYGISFLIVFTGATVGWAFVDPSFRKGTGHLLLAGFVFAGVFFYGQSVLPPVSSSARQSLVSVKGALLQPNIDQYKKWSEEFEEEIRTTLQTMGDDLTDKNVRLAVWPESALPDALTAEPYQEMMTSIAEKSGAYQLIGSNLQEENKQYVGAYLVDPQTEKLQHYEKVKLVPFGEYIPFEKWVRKWFSNVEVLGELGVFSPGTTEQSLLDMGGVKLGSTVCYEAIFPQLWMAQNRQGAQLFVNITNDAWFFRTAAPYQHLAANVLRAVETGRPVLRAANTGFSAYIDPYGRIQNKSSLFDREILYVTVPLSLKQLPNAYTQWGDWFAWLCAALFFTLLISTIVFAYD
jgi:apolipoprotein N-acyltransferase